MDFVPGFWDWLIRSFQNGMLISLDSVLADELEPRGDEVSIWGAAHKDLFHPMDAPALTSMKLVAAWATDPARNYLQFAQSDFLAKVDSQLVAYAHAHALTVVTQEESKPESKKVIKIPDACKALQVPCMDTFKILRTEHARFVLSDDHAEV